jgi:excisionase family DNA binding protein
MPKLITITEVATIFCCTISAVRRWRREGRIKAVKLGRLVRFNEDEVNRIAREGLAAPRRDR